MEIAVVGGGNGCYAAAADLTEKGHKVRWWRRNPEAFPEVLETQSIKIRDAKGTRNVLLSLVSTDLSEVIRGAELIMIPLPAFAQQSIASLLAPMLEDGQIVFLPPGTFGSYVMSKVLLDAGCTAEVIFAETGTLPYLARKHGSDTISISGKATRLPTGFFPADRSEYAFHRLKIVYPSIERVEDALSGALMNAGPIIHPPLIMMNAGPIEHFDSWDIHNEGTQPSIRRIHDALDKERIAIRRALGYRKPDFPLSDHYNEKGEEWMYGKGAHEQLVDGEDWYEPLNLQSHRYMREDIACGLAFIVSLADWLNIKTPIAAGLLALASAISGEDIRRSGRTLENLELSEYSLKQMKDLLQHGVGVSI